MESETAKIEYKAEFQDLHMSFEMESLAVAEYVLREISQYVVENSSNKTNDYDIFVHFFDKKFTPAGKYEQISGRILKYGDIYAICIKAHFRNTWVTVKENENRNYVVGVYLDIRSLAVNKLKRIFTMDYLYPWQNSIVDFFHGIYLVLLQIKLFHKRAIIAHAVALVYKGVCFTLLADAASGKSTLIDTLAATQICKFIAEDYCVITEHMVSGVFNQRRITEKARFNRDKTLDGFLNALFCRVMSLFGKEEIRISSVDELFRDTDVTNNAHTETLYYLKRGDVCNEDYSLFRIVLKVMKREINNWAGVSDWLWGSGRYEEFWAKYQTVLTDISKTFNYKVWSIPFCENVAEFIWEVKDKMDGEVN